MDPGIDFVAYLAKIDWLLAVVVATVSIAMAALLKRFLEPAFDQAVELAHEARLAITQRAMRRRSTAADMTRWACPVCRSINAPGAAVCYRGCGPRPPDAAIPTDNAAEERAIQRGGRSGRRGG